jgi:hypothetical protein
LKRQKDPCGVSIQRRIIIKGFPFFLSFFAGCPRPLIQGVFLNISVSMMPTNRNLNGTSPVQCRKDNSSTMLSGKNIILTGEYMIVNRET